MRQLLGTPEGVGTRVVSRRFNYGLHSRLPAQRSMSRPVAGRAYTLRVSAFVGQSETPTFKDAFPEPLEYAAVSGHCEKQ